MTEKPMPRVLPPDATPMPAFARTAFAAELASSVPRGPAQAAPASVAELIDDWRAAAQLAPAEFDALLAAEGLGRSELARLIAARDRGEAGPPAPAWRATLRAVLGRIADHSAARSLAPPAAGAPPFAAALDGFVAVAWDDLRARTSAPAEHEIEPAPAAAREPELEIDWTAIAPRLQAQLRTQLLQICQRTLVLELNVARLEGRLTGDTPEARYACYLAALREQPAVWRGLLDEYQAMARALCTAIAAWVAGLCELLDHLAVDRPRLTGLEFAGRSAGGLLPHGGRLRLVELVGGLSDPHRGGRGVWKLWFVDPAAPPAPAGPRRFGVVYKPRSLAVDAHFQALLGFCNRGARCGALHLANLRHARWTPGDPAFPELRVLRLLDRGDHGWVELVQREDCADAAAAARFYLRQGAYLALLHVLDAADLHYENVIAAGEQPALVDLETLFHPWIAVAGDAEAAPRDAAGRAAARLRGSVIRTALLPGRAWGDRERAGVNVGGLGDGRAQLSPRAALDWAHAGTDAMHATERRFAVPPGDNVPRAGGQAAPVAHHVEPLVAGFEAMLRFLIGERDALLGPGGAIRRFAGDPMRRLLRATSAYSHLLEAASHPDHLRDALDRERLFDLLWTASRGVPHLLRAVGHERRDLCDGDVPYFTARPGSCDLWDSRGEPIAEWFAQPPLATAAAQLAALGPDDLAAQVFVIRAAVSAASIASAAPDRAAAPLAARGRTPLDAARAIGELLEATAITGERDATWLGMNAARDGAGVELGPVGGGLYDGTGGIALFLGWLGRLTGEARFTRLARRAAEATRGAVAVDDEPGGLVGAPSQLYALAQLAALWDEPALVPPLHPILARIAARIAAGASFDVVHGAAGCILALLAVHELTGDDQILPVVATAGRAVLAGALREGPGAAWPCTVAARPLLGFSHGAAGIAAALLRLAGVAARRPEIDLDPEPLVALARAGFEFERGQLDAAAGNWPDLRDPPAGAGAAPRFLLAYCHGAPGIALSRLAALPLGTGDPARRDLEIAIAATLAGRVQDNQTLCHGELGNLMIAQRAAVRLDRPDWRAAVDRRLDLTLARLLEGGPACSFDFPPAAPALMDGIAGIGYGLLYLSRPDEVPFVLDLSPHSDLGGDRSAE